MTNQTFSAIVGILEGAYLRPLTETQKQVWWGLLSHLPDESARWAALEICRMDERFPTPARLITTARGAPPPKQPALTEPSVPLDVMRNNIARLHALARDLARKWGIHYPRRTKA